MPRQDQDERGGRARMVTQRTKADVSGFKWPGFCLLKGNLKITEERLYFIYNKERNEVLALPGYQFC